MMRAAIYARYSSDLQSPSSIGDQIRVCRALCADRGWTIAQIFVDEAMTGSTDLRPGYQALQQGAMNGAFDVIVAEGLDRLSRDQEHVAALHKRMRFLDVMIVTRAEGEINELHIGLGGTMNALFLRQLAQKTHRGLEGRIRAGKSAGGLSYGYKLLREPLPDGTWTTGDRQIDQEEAAVVHEIFEAYARGKSGRSIAIDLNARGVPPPRATACATRAWSFSTIQGNWQRGTGILNNDLYVGRLIWNKQRYVKDPQTGKRQARLNPREDWLVEEVPHLRIIDDELWDQVKRIQSEVRHSIIGERDIDNEAPRSEVGRRARYLLSGLLECGCCGSGYSMISDRRYGCSAKRNKGTCSNSKTILRSEIEEHVLNGLRDRLMAPELLDAFVAEFRREMQKLAKTTDASRNSKEKRLAQVQKEISNVVAAVTQGLFHASMKAQLDALETERAALTNSLAELPRPEPVVLHPNLPEIYKRKVAALISCLNAPEEQAEATQLLRTLIERVVILPTDKGHDLELYGELAAILQFCEGDGGKSKARGVSAGFKQLTVVAGAGFEPATFRL